MVFLFNFSIAQIPLNKMWDKRYGGLQQDAPNAFQQTKDNGYILGGWSYSGIGGDKTEASWGENDYWIVKTDSLGNKQWDKRYGGTRGDRFEALAQTNDGGYMLAGTSASGIGGDKTEDCRGKFWNGNDSLCYPDFWVVKIDSVGNKQWDKRYGGPFTENCYAVQQTIDGGYLIGCTSNSNSGGDKTQSAYGGANNDWDFWVIKIDSVGNKQWDRQYGNYDDEYLQSINQTSNGGFILGGYTKSGIGNDISKSPRGGFDYWIIKIDASGNKIWDSRMGGSNDEYFYGLAQTKDNGYILHGTSRSGISGDKSQSSFGNYDVWIVKLNSLGVKEWDASFGGTGWEWGGGYPYKQGDIVQTYDSGYLFGATSTSPASGNKSENNLFYGQTWVIKTDSMGSKEWDKTIFTKGLTDKVLSIQSSDSCFVFANYSWSDPGAYKTATRLGIADYWLLKFCNCQSTQLPNAFFTFDKQIVCQTACVQYINYSDCYDSCYWSFPGGIPSFSTHPTPVICYPDTGFYSASLIVYNATGTDTLIQNNCIHVQIPHPFITINGDTLLSSMANSYQWYDAIGPIFDETNQQFIPQVSGYYYVCITDSFGCSNCTDSVYFDITSILDFYSSPLLITIFPNPTSGELKVRCSSDGELTVNNLAGKTLFKQKIKQGEKKLNVANIANGFYLLHFSDGKTKANIKLLKQ
jgi:hypothetical protein